jgi:hypothetical protein
VGRHLLLILGAALALATAGCRSNEDAAGVTSVTNDAAAAHASARGIAEPGAHAGLPCARCHAGAPLARDIPAASAAACRDCHDDGGPRNASLGAVSLVHRSHTGAAAIAAECASCHTHERGDQELAVTTTGCALCHAANLDGSDADGCRLCHTSPGHVALTSQGVPVLHAEMPWIGRECVRCHYDVGRPGTGVVAAACASCHRDAAAVTERGAGLDLHPSHTGVTCTACHEEAVHRVVAMSTGVRLSCTQCHPAAHDVTPRMEFEPATCNGCHVAEHAAEQRLMLGAAPAGVTATPGDKFLLGMTCRSCHVPTADASATRTSCVGCHSPEYATVLSWWERGSAERVAQTSQYVAAARAAAASATADSARVHAAAADSLLRFVQQGGPAHNLPLSHRALETALERAASAWRAAGRSAPARPDLGTVPRMGQCTYCHYEWRQPRFQLDMPDAFHQRVMQRGRDAAASARTSPP